MDRAFLKTK